MKKHLCKVADSKDGLLIAEDLYTKYGNVLVLENTEINSYIRNKLLSFGVEEIRVYEELPVKVTPPTKDEVNSFGKEYTVYVRTIKEVVTGLASGRNLDFEKINFISNSLYKQIKNSHIIINCINQLKLADQYTYTHSINVSLYAMLLGKWLNLDSSKLKDLVLSGVLHDMGKAKIPQNILNKVGPLLENEFAHIKKHPQFGYEIIKNIPDIDSKVKEAVLTHHEKENGTGYPFGLKGDNLCLYSKIITIADVYDAITSSRVYRPKMTPFDAFKEFESIGIGTGYFDTAILLCFFSNIARHYTGSNVTLEDGRTGKVVYVPPHNISSPVVKVDDEYFDLSTCKDVKIVELS